MVCLRKPSRLWYLRASGGREGRSWLKALHLSRELVASPGQRQRLVAAARQGFEDRAKALAVEGGVAARVMAGSGVEGGAWRAGAADGGGGGGGAGSTGAASGVSSGAAWGVSLPCFGYGAGGAAGGVLTPTPAAVVPGGTDCGAASVQVSDLGGTAVEGPVSLVFFLGGDCGAASVQVSDLGGTAVEGPVNMVLFSGRCVEACTGCTCSFRAGVEWAG